MKMKNSGIEWIGDIPDDWEVKRLKDVAISMNSGGTPNSSDESFYSDNGTPWVIIADMKTDFVFDTQKKLSEKGLKDKKLHVYPQGTILYAMYASVGKVSELKIDAAVNQAILAIIVDKCSTNNSFLKYSLKAYEQFVAAESNGNTQYNLNAYKVSNFSFAFCSLSMQEIIAGFLDKKCAAVDRLIENQSKQIEKLKEYKQSVITEAVTKGLNPSVPMKDSGIEWIVNIPEKWKIKPLKTLFSFYKGLPITKADLKETGERVISYGQIHAKYNKSSGVNERLYRYIDKQYILTNPDSIVTAGDFIFADTSEDVEGAGDFVYIDKGDLIFAGYHCIILKHKFEFDNRYIAYLFMSKEWKQQIQSRVCGIKVYSISRAMLSQASVLLPHIEEQQQIADYLDKKCEKIDKLIALKQQKIEKLNEYKKSLIYEYVTGKKEVG